MATKLKFVKAKVLSVPPINPNPCGLTAEAFENIREWRLSHKEDITQDDLKWYYEALEEDKKEQEMYSTNNPTYKAMVDSIEKGYDEYEREAAELEAREKQPETDDIGPMPDYGSSAFWIWCHKRKEIRLKKEAAIIAAGGTIPPAKGKKVKK